MRFISDGDLRQWVQENLQRKLIQQAHELAVQTGCEVLVRLQDGRESQNCKYYVTDKMRNDFMSYGVRAGPGDQPMSGESGLPKKYVHDFTCQVACEPIGPIPFTPEPGDPQEAEIVRVQQNHQPPEPDSHVSDEWQKLYREKFWSQQSYLASKAQHTAISLEDQRPSTNGQLTPVYPPTSSVQSDVTVPMESHESRDTALQNLKQLHLQRIMRCEAEQETRKTEFTHQANDNECVRVIAVPQEHAEQRNEFVYVSQLEKFQLATRQMSPSEPRPSQSHPEFQPQNNLEQNVIATLPNCPDYDPKKLSVSPVATQQRYLCRICERTFCDIYNLVSHAKMFHSTLSDLIFSCNSCPSYFEDARSLHDHLMTHGDLGFFAGAACLIKSHGKDRQNVVQQRRFPCPECGKIFSRFGFMQSHIERVHGGTRIAASIDTTALSKDTTGTADVSMASPIGPNTRSPAEFAGKQKSTFANLYQCTDCDERFESPEILQQHIKESHVSPKTRSAPPSFTGNAEPPEQRLRSKSQDVLSIGKEIFTCQECGMQFPRGKLLQNHVNKYHIPGDPTMESHREDRLDTAKTATLQSKQQCSNTANSAVAVKTEPNQEILDLSTNNSLAYSNQTLPGGPSVVPSYFPNSSPGTPRNEDKQNEDEEMSIENDQFPGQKRFACDVCGKTYKYGFHMKEHRLTHAAVCPFVCRMCGMGFFRQRQLRDHELRHTGAYPCHCEICGKGFPRTSELKRHLAFRHSSHLDMFTRKKLTSLRNEQQT
nr:zinc finger protein 574-like [Lytechinus pictus]